MTTSTTNTTFQIGDLIHNPYETYYWHVAAIAPNGTLFCIKHNERLNHRILVPAEQAKFKKVVLDEQPHP